MQTNRRTLVVVVAVVPAPTSADAMTVVFGRFDRVALACAAVALVAEGLLARAGKSSRLDMLRAAAVAADHGPPPGGRRARAGTRGRGARTPARVGRAGRQGATRSAARRPRPA